MQDYTAVMLLILDILQQLIERMHPLSDAHFCLKIQQTLSPLLKIKKCPKLRVQILFTATFLYDGRDLQEHFGIDADLTDEDVSVLFTSEGHCLTSDKVLTFVECLSFSSDNCRRLLEGGALEFLRKLIESDVVPETKYRITSLNKKLVK